MVYKLMFHSIVEEYIKLDYEAIESISLSCIASDFHLIDKSDATVETSLDGGTEFPDYYFQNGIPLFSEKLYNDINPYIQKNVLKKKFTIVSKAIREEKKYIMLLPLRIDCIDMKRSEFFDIGDEIPCYDVTELFIDESKIGNATFFKLANAVDSGIYVTETIKGILEKNSYEGFSVLPYRKEEKPCHTIY